MNLLPTKTLRKRNVLVPIALGTGLIAAFAGAYVYRTVFQRPGEAALKYIPADAFVVMSVDLSPSPTQTLAFKHIDDALNRNGLGRFAESSILDMFAQTSFNAELQPLIRRGGAGCVEHHDVKGDGEFTGLVFLAVSDGTQANDILKKHCPFHYFKGVKFYAIPKSKMLAMVVDDLLVLTDSPADLLKVRQIQQGELKSIISDPEFLAARDQVASDANVLAFASKKMFQATLKDAFTKAPDWMALGIAVRDGGIGISVAGKTDLKEFPAMKEYMNVPGVRADLLQVLPTGSYGLIATSDPAEAFADIEKTMEDQKGAKKAIKEAEDSTEKSIGLSVKEDILPALKGNSVVGIYPSTTDEPAGVDLLAVIDDQNGGNPASAIEKFQAFMEKQNAKEGDAPKMFVKKALAEGNMYRINDKLEADMQKSMGDGIDSSQFNKPSLVGNKTVVFATIGKVVFASTSQDLLNRAVASYGSKSNGLAGDTRFAPYEKNLLDGSQSVIALSLGRIAEGVKNTVHSSKMKDDDAKLFNSILDAFSTAKDPFSIKTKAMPNGVGAGGVFVPLDYDKMIDMVGTQMNKKK